eukprot:TRINITY_DN3633_c0_g1_i1.p1 TRINITY_DN3633_c0_g1~~TRINITY_DN3633_c0_g1_i1.p1  ORF type:complete len:186 (-),score=41.72 TRINITY_DN3633_c0_g1_i1:223-780(-)
MAKCPDFAPTNIKGSSVINMNKSVSSKWKIFLVNQNSLPESGFVFRVRVTKLQKNNNSWGLIIGAIYANQITKSLDELEFNYDYFIGHNSLKGCGYIGLTGNLTTNDGQSANYGNPYKEDDEVLMIVRNDKTVEFFLNNESQGRTDPLEGNFPLCPVICMSSFASVELISLNNLCDDDDVENFII